MLRYKVVVECSRQETLDLRFVLFGTCEQGIPVISKGQVLPEGFDRVLLRFMVREVTTGLYVRVNYDFIINDHIKLLTEL
ncbi:unnamed protein product [Schistosoma margrebowiei]|uniref:Uncharacterized protein n=1 Tax=Schistosoma margrebowiei TaxID=48269 RepID=A0A183LWI3_9TREM|nr:unnamed protein product [Schistosoma margrebowiei]